MNNLTSQFLNTILQLYFPLILTGENSTLFTSLSESLKTTVLGLYSMYDILALTVAMVGEKHQVFKERLLAFKD